MEVYFLHSPASDALKIGRSKDVAQRVAEICAMSPTDLVLVGAVQGSAKLESLLHQYFRDCRIRGEWFRISSECAAALIQVLRHCPPVKTLRELRLALHPHVAYPVTGGRRRGAGRPKRDPNSRRLGSFVFRVTTAEKAELERRANGEPLSEYLRRIAFATALG